jgi:mono/diheme cytochrome c family protein
VALASVIVAGAAAAFAVAAAVGDPVAGTKVFQTAGCTGCHTLAAVGATGTVGPNLDQRKPAYDTVVAHVTSGKGVMPAFGGILSAQQIADVAAFVSQATGGAPRRHRRPCRVPPPTCPAAAASVRVRRRMRREAEARTP